MGLRRAIQSNWITEGVKLTKALAKNPPSSRTVGLALGGFAAAGLVSTLATPIDMFGKGRLDTGNGFNNFAANVAYGAGRLTGTWSIPGMSSSSTAAGIAGAASDMFNGKPSIAGFFGTVVGGSAAGGAMVGAGLTALLGRRSGFKLGRIMAGGVVGGAVGFYQSARLMRGVSNVASRFHKQIRGLDPMQQDHRAFGGGSGYMSWHKPRQGRMPVGHLGATGDLVHAMHKTRHQSTF